MTEQDLKNKGWFLTKEPDEWCHEKIEPFSMYKEEAEELEIRIDKGEPFLYVVTEIINRSTYRNYQR